MKTHRPDGSFITRAEREQIKARRRDIKQAVILFIVFCVLAALAQLAPAI